MDFPFFFVHVWQTGANNSLVFVSGAAVRSSDAMNSFCLKEVGYSRNNKAIEKQKKNIVRFRVIGHFWTIIGPIPGVKERRECHCLMLFQLNFLVLPVVEEEK